MKIRVDSTLCTGHARCNAAAPDAYPVDEAGFNLLRGQELECDPALEAQFEAGAASCPERAITIIR